jgi:hypothetical protein
LHVAARQSKEEVALIMNPFKHVFLAGLATAAAAASPLTETAAVQTMPDPSAPAITFLKAGSEPVPAPPGAAPAPPGWMAVSVPGPFEGYVENKNLTKDLLVRPGAPLFLAPAAGAGVLAIAAKGDSITITGIRGKWTQVRLGRNLVGFIRVGPEPGAAPVAGPAPAFPAPAVSEATPGRPPEVSSAGGYEVLPRYFEGRFVSAKRRVFWEPTRPYAWQLVGPSGSRIAYVDASKLLLTDQLDNYIGKNVLVRGTPRHVLATDDIVVVADSLELK